MEKYLINQYTISKNPADSIASDGSFIKETVLSEIASADKSPGRILFEWLFLNQIDYSISLTAAGRFVDPEGYTVWEWGDCSADLPHLASTLVVSTIYQ